MLLIKHKKRKSQEILCHWIMNIYLYFQYPQPQDPISDNTYEGVYKWVENGLLPVLHPDEYYNGERVSLEDSMMIADSINYRVTPLRIAQHRVKPGKTIETLGP